LPPLRRGRDEEAPPFQPDIIRTVDGTLAAADAGRSEETATATLQALPMALRAGAGTKRPKGTDMLANPSAAPAPLPARRASDRKVGLLPNLLISGEPTADATTAE